jgi:hypothetical protein
MNGRPTGKRSIKRQHRVNAAKQRTWAKEADNDARYNEKQAKRERGRGMFVEARASEKEAKVDRQWASKRRKIAKKESMRGR